MERLDNHAVQWVNYWRNESWTWLSLQIPIRLQLSKILSCRSNKLPKHLLKGSCHFRILSVITNRQPFTRSQKSHFSILVGGLISGSSWKQYQVRFYWPFLSQTLSMPICYDAAEVLRRQEDLTDWNELKGDPYLYEHSDRDRNSLTGTDIASAGIITLLKSVDASKDVSTFQSNTGYNWHLDKIREVLVMWCDNDIFTNSLVCKRAQASLQPCLKDNVSYLLKSVHRLTNPLLLFKFGLKLESQFVLWRQVGKNRYLHLTEINCPINK